MMPITRRTLRDSRRLLAGYCVALVLLIVIMGAVWPTIKEQGGQFQKLLDSYPPAMQAFFGDFSEFTTPAGFLRGELFSFMLPLIFLIFSIGRSAEVMAGEEERGRLDVLLAEPVSRRQLLLGKAAGVAIGTCILGVAVLLPLIGVDIAWRMEIGAVKLLAAVVTLVLLALAFTGVSFAVSGARGRKGLAIAVTSAIAVAAFLLHSLSNLVEWLKPARALSPFYYYARESPLASGFDTAAIVVLLGVCVVSVAVAAWVFDRRDVGIG